MGKRGKIFLMNPPSEVWREGTRHLRPLLNSLPQLGIAYLAAVLRKDGFNVRILDAQALGLPPKEVIGMVKKWSPDLLGLTGYTSSVTNAARIAREAKEEIPDLTAVLGGPHVTAKPTLTLSRFPEFDFALIGEGESNISSLFGAIINRVDGALPKDVPGAVYRNGDKIVVNERPPFISELDTIPPPALKLFPDFPSAYRPPILHSPKGRAATLVTSRGCPFRCTFCDRAVFGERYRFHSVDYIIDMIRRLKTDFGITHIIFYDDNFTARKRHTEELLEAIMRLPFKITWNCDARADQVDFELLKLMKGAGAWMINYGIETADSDQLEKLNKSLSLERAADTIRLTREAGIMSKGLFMIGAPGETMETIEKTRDFVLNHPLDFLNLSKFTPYPGSEIYDDIHKHGDFNEEWEEMNAMNFVFIPHTIDRERLEAENNRLIKDFYRSPGRLKTFFKGFIKNPRDTYRILVALIGHIKYKIKNLFPGGRKGFDY